MAMVGRAQIFKELEPGLNAVFGESYKDYAEEHIPLFNIESSARAFEEEVLFPGFGSAVVKPEGQAVSYASTGEAWMSRYNHETVALAFAITEEAIEDNLYVPLSKRLTKSLAKAMAHTKQVKAANVFNNAFSSSYVGGDGVALIHTAHPLVNGDTLANRPSTDAELSETALEAALVAIAGWTDDKGIPSAVNVVSLHIPRQLVFVAERLLGSTNRTGTPDNDINAIYSMNSIPKGFFVNHRFTDTKAWFLKTDATDGTKMFERAPLKTAMEGDFETGNVRYKARERYSFGWSDWRGWYGTQPT